MPILFKELSFYNDVINVIGAIYAGKLILSASFFSVKFFRSNIMPLLYPTPDFRKTYGEWAVVTGASDGIGEAYAHELARRKMNLLLVSRTESKLKKVSNSIETLHGVKTKYVALNFNQGLEACRKLEIVLQDLDIGILVNNVGVIVERPMKVHEMTEECLNEHINVNIVPVSVLSRTVIPQMLEKHRGAIVNLSSVAGLFPAPLFAVYGASKTYVDHFSQALECEYKGKGITVQTLIPSYVNTQMVAYSKYLMNSLFVPSPSVYARHAVRTLGYARRTTGYWLHDIMVALVSCLPVRLLMTLTKRVNTYFQKNAKR